MLAPKEIFAGKLEQLYAIGAAASQSRGAAGLAEADAKARIIAATEEHERARAAADLALAQGVRALGDLFDLYFERSGSVTRSAPAALIPRETQR